MPRKLEYVPLGSVFGKLTLVKELDRYLYPEGNTFLRHFKCKCECGNYTVVSLRHLRRTKEPTTSCGCLRLDNVIKKCKTHGLRYHPLYNVYYGMRYRCYNEKSEAYERYGGRGITVCKRWMQKRKGFIKFYEWAIEKGWKEGLELDRKNNDGRYSPENCRFVTPEVNSNNRRDNVTVLYKNKKVNFRDLWKKKSNKSVSYRAACKRLRKGASPLEAIGASCGMFTNPG